MLLLDTMDQTDTVTNDNLEPDKESVASEPNLITALRKENGNLKQICAQIVEEKDSLEVEKSSFLETILILKDENRVLREKFAELNEDMELTKAENGRLKENMQVNS